MRHAMATMVGEGRGYEAADRNRGSEGGGLRGVLERWEINEKKE